MPTLRVEHPVLDYDLWKAAFDGDPAGREQAGVRSYRVMRAMDDPDNIMIDLEFETRPEAEAMLSVLRSIWQHVVGKIIGEPRAHIVETVEAKRY